MKRTRHRARRLQHSRRDPGSRLPEPTSLRHVLTTLELHGYFKSPFTLGNFLATLSRNISPAANVANKTESSSIARTVYCNGTFIFRACHTIDNVYFSCNLSLNRATHVQPSTVKRLRLKRPIFHVPNLMHKLTIIYLHWKHNRPFPSSRSHPYRNEDKFLPFLVMIMSLHENETSFSYHWPRP